MQCFNKWWETGYFQVMSSAQFSEPQKSIVHQQVLQVRNLHHHCCHHIPPLELHDVNMQVQQITDLVTVSTC